MKYCIGFLTNEEKFTFGILKKCSTIRSWKHWWDYLKMLYVITLKNNATLRREVLYLPRGLFRLRGSSSSLLIIPHTQSKVTWSFDALLCNAPVIILSFNKAGEWRQAALLPSHVSVIYFFIFSQLRNNLSCIGAWRKCDQGSGAL